MIIIIKYLNLFNHSIPNSLVQSSYYFKSFLDMELFEFFIACNKSFRDISGRTREL